MDIEGSELSALRGMTETLRRSPSIKLLVEYNELSDQPALQLFLQKHFRNVTPVRDSLWCF
jgi:hypothetical protein